MTLHDQDTATSFSTKPLCQQWIDERVVRFKLKMVRTRTADGETTYVPNKYDGRIHNTQAEGFKPSGTDEPLANYAAPEQRDGKWFAVMRLQES